MFDVVNCFFIMAHKVTLFFDYLKGERSLFCKIHTYLRTNLHFFSFTSKGKVFLFAQIEAFFSVSCHSLPFGKSCGPCCAADKADRRCFPTKHSISSDGPQHILRRSTVPSPSKHIAFSRSALSKTSKSVLKNYFQGLKIYFQGLVIYFQGLIIYFQGLKIILSAA